MEYSLLKFKLSSECALSMANLSGSGLVVGMANDEQWAMLGKAV